MSQERDSSRLCLPGQRPVRLPSLRGNLGRLLCLATALILLSVAAPHLLAAPRQDIPIFLPLVANHSAGLVVVKTIGPGGGQIVSADGNATLVIAPNALGEPTPISIARSDQQPLGLIGSLYTFGPGELHFALPATLRLRLRPSDIPAGTTLSDLTVATLGEDVWIPLATTANAGNRTLTTQIEHFSDFGAMDPGETPPDDVNLSGFWNDSGRETRIAHSGSNVTAHYVEPYVCDHADGTGETSETDLNFTATLSGNTLTGETSTCVSGEDNPLGVGIRMAEMELTISEDGNELVGTWHNDYDDTDETMSLNRNCEDSGPQWVERFLGSRDTADLTPGFGADVDGFIAALRAAGATVTINATYRPPERAYLMHYAFRIARDNLDPNAVPEMAGVHICWMHRDADGNDDLAASRTAAAQMVAAYGIVHRPALTSRHTERLAIDMNISWTGTLTINDGQDTQTAISSRPRSGQNTELHDVGATYGVNKLVSDRPHWSNDGH